MAEYVKKTCNLCGLRDIQPNMVRAEKTTRTGSSSQSIDGGTVVGILFGNQDSGKRLRKVMFNNNKRSYKRKSVVWMCPDCAGVRRSKQKKLPKDRAPLYTFKGISQAFFFLCKFTAILFSCIVLWAIFLVIMDSM